MAGMDQESPLLANLAEVPFPKNFPAPGFPGDLNRLFRRRMSQQTPFWLPGPSAMPIQVQTPRPRRRGHSSGPKPAPAWSVSNDEHRPVQEFQDAGCTGGSQTDTKNCNCSELRGNQQPAAFQEGIEAPGPPSAKERCQGHFAVAARFRAGAAADFTADH